MRPFAEADVVRITRPVDVAEDGEVYHFAAGTEGTVVDVCASGRAYCVEFLAEPAVYDKSGDMVEFPVFVDAIFELEELLPV